MPAEFYGAAGASGLYERGNGKLFGEAGLSNLKKHRKQLRYVRAASVQMETAIFNFVLELVPAISEEPARTAMVEGHWRHWLATTLVPLPHLQPPPRQRQRAVEANMQLPPTHPHTSIHKAAIRRNRPRVVAAGTFGTRTRLLSNYCAQNARQEKRKRR